MTTDEQFISIKQWASKNGILLFEGDYNDVRRSSVELPNDESSFDVFKEICVKIETKIIVLNAVIYDDNFFDLFEEKSPHIEDEQFHEKLLSISRFKSQCLEYKIIVFHNGITFIHESQSPEILDFYIVKGMIDNYLSATESLYEGYKPMPENAIQEFVVQLSELDLYSKLKSRDKRRGFAENFFKAQIYEWKDKGFYDGFEETISDILEKAEMYYELEVKPKKELELKAKITELLNSGKTKVKIAAELEISKDTLNKFI